MRVPAPGRSPPAPRRQQTVATPSPGLNCAQAQPTCFLLSPHQGSPASCNNIILNAISNNLHLAFKMMVMPTSHQPPCCYTFCHHTLFEPRSVPLRTLEELLASQLNLGILGKFHKLQSSNSPCFPTTSSSPTSSRI
ncbi:hypothetical protein QL285_007745 [Trifolium repens]|nr:hypothetical protein QL285_007745 [Trifolium repens]